MTQKLYGTNEKIGLGFLSLPILEFNERYELLEKNNPQLTPLERAATVYFGMLSDTPKPTKDKNAFYIDWNFAVPRIYQENGKVKIFTDKVLSNNDEKYLREALARYSNNGWALVPFVEADAQTAYLQNLKNLQDWLIYNGLYDGIKITLAEESRKLQAQAAAAAASAQSAAYALAMSRINADISQEARIEAAQNEKKAKEQLDEALKDEAETKQKISDLKNGIITKKKSSSFGTIAAIAAAAALWFLG